MSTPSTPDIGTVITNATARRAIYAAFILVAFIAACTQVAFAAAGIPNPVWLTVTLAVIAFATTPILGLAVANTSSAGQTQAVADAIVQQLPVATVSLPSSIDPDQPLAGTPPGSKYGDLYPRGTITP